MKSSGEKAKGLILVVEDDPGLSKLIEVTLRKNGWDVVAAFSAAEALRKVTQECPALLLLDYSLPDMSGADLLTEADRRGLVLPPFIVVTGRGDEKIAVDMMKQGARDYIVKDAHLFDALTLAVKRTLEQLEVERRLRETERLLREHSDALAASREELRALADRLLIVPEQERARIAREIHDLLAQDLIRLKIDLIWTRDRITEKGFDPMLLRERFAEMVRIVDGAITCVQKIATELRPAVLDSLGLCAAIEWQVQEFQERTGIRFRVTVPEEEPLPMEKDVATALFRILQEALNNIRRHAGANRVQVLLRREEGSVFLRIRDNGSGIDPARLKDPLSIGLVGMRERAALLGGTVEIRSKIGVGTTVEARVPWPQEKNGEGS